MNALLGVWQEAADKWSEVYGQIAEDQWENPTPCDEWTVRELVGHVLVWHATGGRMLGATTSPGDEWPEIRNAFEALLSDPASLDGNVDEFGGVPQSELAGFLIGDLLIHSWDLARSIGVDDTLPAGAVHATMTGLQRVPGELLRGHNPLGQFMMSAPVEVSADASEQDRMLAFTGRRP